MRHEDAVKFFVDQQQEWDRRDIEALSRRHAEDGVIVSPIFGTVRGRADILDSYVSLFRTFPDWKYVGEDILVDGTRGAQEFTVNATHAGAFMGLPPTGRKFDIRGVRMFQMKDGLIAHERRFYDFTGLLIQLGILRGKPAKPAC